MPRCIVLMRTCTSESLVPQGKSSWCFAAYPQATPVFARRIVAACGLVALLLLVCGGFAQASIRHIGTFGSFSEVQSIAVDSSTGDVYVYDAGAGAISKFDAEGKPVDFIATGTNTIAGVGQPPYGPGESELSVDSSNGPAKGDVYLATGGFSPIEIYSAAGSRLGELNDEGLGEICGVGVDPSGDVYVGFYEGYVHKYVPSQNPVENSDLASSVNEAGKPCNVTADAAGDVFAVTYNSGPITRYEASQFGSLAPIGSVVDETGSTVSVDPGASELYVDEQGQVAEFGARGEPFEQPLATFGASGAGAITKSFGVAASGFDHHIYVSDGIGHVSVFAELALPVVTTGSASAIQSTSATLNGTIDPEGLPLSSCVFEYGSTPLYGHSAPCAEDVGTGNSPVSVHADIDTLAPGSSYHFRLVAADANGSEEGADQSFGTPGPPSVADERASRLRQTSALLSAQIDPGNLATTYHVEYGADSSYGHSTNESEPIGQDATRHKASVELQGLQPGVTYHFRFSATNGSGSAGGPDMSFTTAQQSPTPCPNESLRTALSSRLPDCRAYEQVSPIEKKGSATRYQLLPQGLLYKASRDGRQVFYVANGALPGSLAGGQTYYLGSRGESAWTTTPLSPSNLLSVPPLSGPYGVTGEYDWLSEDLSCQVVRSSEPLTSDTPQADAAMEVRNLYRRDPGGGYTLVTDAVPYETPTPDVSSTYTVLGASDDCKTIYFQTGYAFLPGVPKGLAQYGGQMLYEWHEGTLRLAGVLPNGQLPSNGVTGWNEFTSPKNRVSSDGSRVVFLADGKIYLREGGASGSPRTIDVSASQSAIATEPIYVTLQGASQDDSRVFFLANYGLAANSSPARCESSVRCVDLYEYDVESERLADLSADGNGADAGGASVEGVFDISEDGSSVYFAAHGQLTPSSGDPEENSEAANEANGELNIYLSHDGKLSFVARVTHLDVNDNEIAWGGDNVDLITDSANWTARTTPDGAELIFTSRAPLTGYDNVDAATGVRDPELFMFSSGSGHVACISCDPSGAAPVYAHAQGQPREKPLLPHIGSAYGGVLGDAPRVISENGDRVFFESSDQLSSLAKSGEVNVYEWELAGSGSCTTGSAAYGAASGGCIYLLDSGVPANTFAPPAVLVDASASGDDVFLESASSLVGQDGDSLEDVYDLRVDGGVAEPTPAHECNGEECQGLASATPTFATPASASFSGTETRPAINALRPRSKRLTRAQKLARAVKACQKQRGSRKRARCRRAARRRFGPRRLDKAKGGHR